MCECKLAFHLTKPDLAFDWCVCRWWHSGHGSSTSQVKLCITVPSEMRWETRRQLRTNPCDMGKFIARESFFIEIIRNVRSRFFLSFFLFNQLFSLENKSSYVWEWHYINVISVWSSLRKVDSGCLHGFPLHVRHDFMIVFLMNTCMFCHSWLCVW